MRPFACSPTHKGAAATHTSQQLMGRRNGARTSCCLICRRSLPWSLSLCWKHHEGCRVLGKPKGNCLLRATSPLAAPPAKRHAVAALASTHWGELPVCAEPCSLRPPGLTDPIAGQEAREAPAMRRSWSFAAAAALLLALVNTGGCFGVFSRCDGHKKRLPRRERLLGQSGPERPFARPHCCATAQGRRNKSLLPQ